MKEFKAGTTIDNVIQILFHPVEKKAIIITATDEHSIKEYIAYPVDVINFLEDIIVEFISSFSKEDIDFNFSNHPVKVRRPLFMLDIIEIIEQKKKI